MVSRTSAPPGRRSLAQWARLVDECLRHLDDPVRLRQSPLARLAGVGAYARRQHPLNPHGEVLALQELLCQAVDVSLPALPPRKREFLERYARGRNHRRDCSCDGHEPFAPVAGLPACRQCDGGNCAPSDD